MATEFYMTASRWRSSGEQLEIKMLDHIILNADGQRILLFQNRGGNVNLAWQVDQ